jgi:hypothetical protein
MTIDVNALVTDAQLDDFLGGQLNAEGTALRPLRWTSSLPARQEALDDILRLFRDATPTIAETDITDVTRLAHAVKLGAAARVYELALSNVGDGSVFYAMRKDYRDRFDKEVRKQIDIAHASMAPDPKGRGRRSISVVRR